MKIVLKTLPFALSVCKLASTADMDMSNDFYFLGKTDAELSLVCKTSETPKNVICREDGWRGFFIEGELDFSLVGVLAGITGILADNDVAVFAVSTYNTDYILVKEERFADALRLLSESGYVVVGGDVS